MGPLAVALHDKVTVVSWYAIVKLSGFLVIEAITTKQCMHSQQTLQGNTFTCKMRVIV